MNDIVIAIILGVVEGLTEFLPVSSTGHLILVGNWLNFTGDKANAFEIFIQLGAILAVIGYFWKRIWRVLLAIVGKSASENPHGLTPAAAWRFCIAIVIAFIPAAVLGLLFEDHIDALLFKPQPVAAALIVGGVAILLIEQFRPSERTEVAESLSLSQALWIGVAQCAALIPGMSRSASTIMGGLLAGLSHAAAAEFSFFLSIPTLAAASLYKLYKIAGQLSGDDIIIFATGFLVSLVVAWVVIAGFMAFIKRHSFAVFAWYRIIFGFAILLMMLFGVEIKINQ
ncbi:MAG: undecaprenyl-diphosphate phosphatase [candidate division KSB1 bacterium]|nr:undecaprenyl-diphosphate phosphatase [candidate division KSB1 bacterium]MDZ7300539.1 undecaprenyl-diphosphate phosphatase [candidate division KSB1 bacterium]MDZ7309678.1 undecaprenyl-diphosphate phosphatase [candidate division KSB1 bacterium]